MRPRTDQIERWWTKNPTASIGIATGVAYSGLLILDVDGQDGLDALARLEAEYGKLPVTRTVKTGDGWHFYFHLSVPVPCTRGKIGPGLDIKADGGYVVAPPSRHENGTQYETTRDTREADCAEWLLDLAIAASRRHSGTAPVESDDTEPDKGTIGEGGRNDWLFREGSSLCGRGELPDRIRRALHALNEALCDPPLPEDEVDTIVKKVVKNYKPSPASARIRQLEAERDLNSERSSWMWRALTNPDLKPYAVFLIRLAFLIEVEVQAGRMVDGFVQIPDAKIADNGLDDRPIIPVPTIKNARSRLRKTGLFTVDTRHVRKNIPRVDPATGEIIGQRSVPRQECWYRVDGTLVEKLEELANYRKSAPPATAQTSSPKRKGGALADPAFISTEGAGILDDAAPASRDGIHTTLVILLPLVLIGVVRVSRMESIPWSLLVHPPLVAAVRAGTPGKTKKTRREYDDRCLIVHQAIRQRFRE